MVDRCAEEEGEHFHHRVTTTPVVECDMRRGEAYIINLEVSVEMCDDGRWRDVQPR